MVRRKVVAHMQSRWGPHRVGRARIIATAGRSHEIVSSRKIRLRRAWINLSTTLRPLLALALASRGLRLSRLGRIRFALFGHEIYLGIAPPDVNIGVLALFAITAMGVYGVALAGWSSNSKYPLAGWPAQLGAND